jgi:aspartate-semialdehyde dehydrogenase
MMQEKYRVGIVGATGMVGQQLIRMLKDHPWLTIKTLAASQKSAGKKYAEAVADRWCMDFALPPQIGELVVQNADSVAEVAAGVDIIFCAIGASKEEVSRLELAYASQGVWVSSCNSAFRAEPLVPMMIPAVNADHLNVIALQRKAWNLKDGAIIVKSNCSIQSYVIALEPLRKFGLRQVIVHSDQAISGAGKTFEDWPEMERNLIPLIAGEEQKSEIEPLKVWGTVEKDGIKPVSQPNIRAKCVRVAVLDGHTAFVTATFDKTPSREEVLQAWESFAACQGLPSAPKKFIHYLSAPDRPQPKLDVMTENGMAISIGQLRVDDFGVSFTALSHNVILGAAGGAVLATELAIRNKLVTQRSLATA